MKKYLPLIAGLLLLMYSPKLKKSISNEGIEHLKFLEGERFTVYLDSANIPTVGVGHKVTPSDNLEVGDSISPQASGTFLRNDLRWSQRAINTHVLVPLNQNQFDALVSFVFNVGTGAFASSTLLKKLNQYDYQGALAEFPRWKYSTNEITKVKEVDPILVSRRRYEQDLFNS